MVSMVVGFPVFLSMHKRVHRTYFFGIMVYLESFGLESFYNDFGDFGSAIGTLHKITPLITLLVAGIQLLRPDGQ
jgi:hypothetical protein